MTVLLHSVLERSNALVTLGFVLLAFVAGASVNLYRSRRRRREGVDADGDRF